VPPDGREIYLEVIQLGNSLKATAIDPVTGSEASVIGPLTAPQGDLRNLAVAKLRRRLHGKTSSGRQTKAPPAGRRGIIV
jgi:hypothetical protein